jgi:phosphotriesterase-related protein
VSAAQTPLLGMALVETVRGPIDVSRLGATLMHEHVFVLSEEIRQNYPAYWNEDARVADAIAQLQEAVARGVRTIVDPTVIGLGRCIPRIARVNAGVDLNIVVATGLYAYAELPFFFQYRGSGRKSGAVDPMAQMFVTDLTLGIAGTGVKAAFLKCCVEQSELTAGIERVLRAVSTAHHRTGAPIVVHTNVHATTGLTAQRVFREEGVDLSRVVLGHSGDSTDLSYLIELMDAGSYIGMDRFGLDGLLPFEQRVATVAELCKAGYAERMVLSHDAACYIDWFSPEVKAKMAPRWHFNHIHDDVLPALRECGVTEAQIDTMLVDNPRRYFTR